MCALNIEQKIISTASALFSKRLYVDVSIMDIVNRAGVARGSFYNYFTTKDECFVKSTIPLIQAIPNDLLAYQYNNNRPEAVLNKSVELIKTNTTVLRNTSAFMYTTENEMLRYLLSNAYENAKYAMRKIYRESLAAEIPGADEAMLNRYSGYLISYITGVMAELRFTALAEENGTVSQGLLMPPEDFLKILLSKINPIK